MGYETRAYIVEGVTNLGLDFIEYEGDWLHASKDCDSEGNIKYYYHCGKTGNQKTTMAKDAKIVTRKFASVLSMVNLCKLGSGNNVPENETEFFIYKDDGNTVFIEDKYGEYLSQMTLDAAIEFFDKQKGHCRVDILLAAMKNIKENFKNRDIYILFYGY